MPPTVVEKSLIIRHVGFPTAVRIHAIYSLSIHDRDRGAIGFFYPLTHQNHFQARRICLGENFSPWSFLFLVFTVIFPFSFGLNFEN